MSFTNLLVVAAVAVLAPMTVGFAPRLRIPAVVLEIVGGIIIGPSGFGWVRVDLPVQILALFGLAFLLFLAGLEIDVHQLRGRLLRFAVMGYLVTLVLGYGAGASFAAAGWVSEPLLLTITLSATSLGLVVQVLKRRPGAQRGGADRPGRGEHRRLRGDRAAVPVLLRLGREHRRAGRRARRVRRARRRHRRRGLRRGPVHAAGPGARPAAGHHRRIRVRFAVLLLVAFTVLAERFGLESILGAFLAGAIVGLVDRDSSSHPNFRTKLDAIGYGFLVPVFFVSGGIRLDLTGLLHSPSALARVPLFLLALLAVRGLPALLGLRANGTRPTLALGLLQATSLPFIVTATQIGVALGKFSSVTAAALVSPACCRC